MQCVRAVQLNCVKVQCVRVVQLNCVKVQCVRVVQLNCVKVKGQCMAYRNVGVCCRIYHGRVPWKYHALLKHLGAPGYM